jgi:hypothetical protein
MAPGDLLVREQWNHFLDEFCDSEVKDVRQLDVEGSAAWILASLFWEHLPSLRLMTSWFYVSALCVQHGSDRLFLEECSLGSLIRALSGAGPPIYDAEDLGAIFDAMGRSGTIWDLLINPEPSPLN